MIKFEISFDQRRIESADFAHSIAHSIVLIAITIALPTMRPFTTRVWMVTTMDGRFYLSHLAQCLSRTIEEKHSLMEIHTAHAQPMGSLIFEGHHKPFHALACPLNPQAVRIAKKK